MVVFIYNREDEFQGNAPVLNRSETLQTTGYHHRADNRNKEEDKKKSQVCTAPVFNITEYSSIYVFLNYFVDKIL